MCQLQEFLQQLFCSKNSESSIPEDPDAVNSDDYQYPPAYSDVAIPNSPDRIVGGVQAEISEAPFVLSTEIFCRHFCTATIISYSWALTAAQCFPGYYAVEKMTVYGGTDRVPSCESSHQLARVQNI